MKKIFALCALLWTFNAFALTENDQFPMGPNPNLTPGSLCDRPEAVRYPEHIKYCGRHVSPDVKARIFSMYDKQLGYKTRRMNRDEFKIDHYIPLCAGGSNNMDNLWPQHESVYTVTDSLEELVCEKMADGVLSQVDAVALIRKGKADLSEVPGIMSSLHQM
jgi:hypothetical protein